MKDSLQAKTNQLNDEIGSLVDDVNDIGAANNALQERIASLGQVS